MVTLIGALVVVLALATVAMLVTALVLSVRGLDLYRRATLLGGAAMRNARQSKTLFGRIGKRARRLRDALETRLRLRASGRRSSSTEKVELAHDGA